MTSVRPAFWAERGWYPSDAEAVRARMAPRDDAQPPPSPPTVLLLPHAAWRYCGDTLAAGVAAVSAADPPGTVVILAPQHRPRRHPLLLDNYDAWRTPLGDVPVDTELRERLRRGWTDASVSEGAHRAEHGVELVLSALVARAPDLRVVPVLVGESRPPAWSSWAQVLRDCLRGSPRALVVVSTDLHHGDRATGDAAEAALIRCAGQVGLGAELAATAAEYRANVCGLAAWGLGQEFARLTGATDVRWLGRSNSSSIDGDTERAVGYAAARFSRLPSHLR